MWPYNHTFDFYKHDPLILMGEIFLMFQVPVTFVHYHDVTSNDVTSSTLSVLLTGVRFAYNNVNQ